MPRGPRLDASGMLHHVMARGVDRQPLFHPDPDRDDFVQRLAALGAAFGRLSTTGVTLPRDTSVPRAEVGAGRQMTGFLGTWDTGAQGLGGWQFNVHHDYDPISQTLFLGDGQRRSGQSQSSENFGLRGFGGRCMEVKVMSLDSSPSPPTLRTCPRTTP